MDDLKNGVSRRSLLQAGAGLAGAVVLPGGMIMPAYAADEPAMGTWPAGSQGATVTIGAAVPRTGAYAVQGEDELKGMQLAVEHINDGHDSDQEDRAQGVEGRARQAGQPGRRRFGRQAERCRAGTADASSTRTRSSP